MQEPIFPSTITDKLYREQDILLATFIGGPLAGGYLLAQNFRILNEPAKVGKTWIFTLGTVVLLFASVYVPALDRIPAMAYSFGFCLAAHTVAKKFQGSSIALHRANGGQFYNGWRAAAVGGISLLIMVAITVALYLLPELYTTAQ